MSTQSRVRVRAFTLVEVAVAMMLSALLLVMVSSTWTALGRSMSATAADGAISSAASMAAQSLRRDLSGHLPATQMGHLEEGRLVGSAIIGGRLLLCYDGDPANGVADWNSPDSIVEYRLSGADLLRTDQDSGDVFVAATGVDAFAVTDIGSGLRVELTLLRRDLSRTYTFIAQDPN